MSLPVDTSLRKVSIYSHSCLSSVWCFLSGKLNLLLRMLYEHKSNACAADGDAVMRQVVSMLNGCAAMVVLVGRDEC